MRLLLWPLAAVASRLRPTRLLSRPKLLPTQPLTLLPLLTKLQPTLLLLPTLRPTPLLTLLPSTLLRPTLLLLTLPSLTKLLLSKLSHRELEKGRPIGRPFFFDPGKRSRYSRFCGADQRARPAAVQHPGR